MLDQPGSFDVERRYEGLGAKSNPLVAILAAVPFELFWRKLKTTLVKGGLRRGLTNTPTRPANFGNDGGSYRVSPGTAAGSQSEAARN